MICFKIHPVSPQRRILEKVVYALKNEDGICVYPTDTVYGMGACVTNPKAVDRIRKTIEKDKSRLFSFICSDFSQVSKFVKMNNMHFKLMKRYLPGPYTFILPATNYVPKKVTPKRKTVGVRIPDNAVCLELVKLLGNRWPTRRSICRATFEGTRKISFQSLNTTWMSCLIWARSKIPHIQPLLTLPAMTRCWFGKAREFGKDRRVRSEGREEKKLKAKIPRRKKENQ